MSEIATLEFRNNFRLSVPLRSKEAGCLFEGWYATEIRRIISGNSGIWIDPLRMLAAEVAAVELIVGIYPAAQNHQFGCREHPAVVVFGVLRMRGIRQQVDHRALRATQVFGRKIRAVVITSVPPEKRREFGNDGTGQLLPGKLFVRRVVELRDFPGQAEPPCRIAFAVAHDAFRVEHRLNVGGVVNDLSRTAVSAVLDKVTRLRLGCARGLLGVVPVVRAPAEALTVRRGSAISDPGRLAETGRTRGRGGADHGDHGYNSKSSEAGILRSSQVGTRATLIRMASRTDRSQCRGEKFLASLRPRPTNGGLPADPSDSIVLESTPALPGSLRPPEQLAADVASNVLTNPPAR